MAAADVPRLEVLLALAATSAVNGAFLFADPRLGHLPAWLAAVFLAGGAAYIVTIPLCVRRKRAGFWLAGLLGAAGAAVAAWDNLALSGGGPNAATFALNVAVVLLAVPMVVGAVTWVRAASRAGPTLLG